MVKGIPFGFPKGALVAQEQAGQAVVLTRDQARSRHRSKLHRFQTYKPSPVIKLVWPWGNRPSNGAQPHRVHF